MVTEEFAEYDLGEEQNMERSGTAHPALYDTENIQNFPIAMLCGKEDLISSSSDYLALRDKLKPVYFKEYELGYLGFLLPRKNDHLIDVALLCR